MKTPLAALFTLVMAIPVLAQSDDPGPAIEAAFAKEGLQVDLPDAETTELGIHYPGVVIGTPGHIREDGWLISPDATALGPLDLSGVAGDQVKKAALPDVSFPLRGTVTTIYRSVLDDVLLPRGGSILDLTAAHYAAGPVTVGNYIGLIASADTVAISWEAGCPSIVADDVALDIGRLAPLAAAAFPKGILRGKLSASFRCDGAVVSLKTVNFVAPELMSIALETEISMDAKAVARTFIESRLAMNALFDGDQSGEEINAADEASFAAAGQVIVVGASTLTITDDGVVRRLGSSFPGGAVVLSNLLPALVGQVLFPEVSAAIAPALASFVQQGGSLEVSFEPNGTATFAEIFSADGNQKGFSGVIR